MTKPSRTTNERPQFLQLMFRVLCHLAGTDHRRIADCPLGDKQFSGRTGLQLAISSIFLFTIFASSLLIGFGKGPYFRRHRDRDGVRHCGCRACSSTFRSFSPISTTTGSNSANDDKTINGLNSQEAELRTKLFTVRDTDPEINGLRQKLGRLESLKESADADAIQILRVGFCSKPDRQAEPGFGRLPAPAGSPRRGFGLRTVKTSVRGSATRLMPSPMTILES
jgi:hypothetical protein